MAETSAHPHMAARSVLRNDPDGVLAAAVPREVGAESGGSGLGKSLKLVNAPVRPRIPMALAALGPKNIALAAELFEAWQPIFYHPESADEVFGDPLAEGRAKRDPRLPDLRIIADAKFSIGDDEHELETARAEVRAALPLYIGGMGARGKNFYHHLVTGLGFGAAAKDLRMKSPNILSPSRTPIAFVGSPKRSG
ncbi:alkanesulfonate monooxygenase SsuD/methylene tetrahydromethanopterin reductase-like flavin-dependent oxidoreductase (luciferase family) [Actinomadura coerulea]|uniref:Alkanesulfonate monooxygenase SsuD/methylene tetrahydromethanopterin reductase-like flavin-dependent oxidoreductase (Luciferase family) n=1 Tax=Actinomadura coerulea TaxID=46159 RepID=A0A7X0FY36_9ACTN|nr:LLM class flavin-dependent oxidoreductase [Actinomadura coerulea]MBB6395669.1 alkanesulfonate monooxygenase SsuD/methylene tetrahydromethanopterin reductase-like flavin-dependent oxidoreductase (luciferase family) [Actinomadura coerulea]GGQ26270.1 hypothetical protein GCM10010187_48500 [Actinomadura coerulea]